MTAVWSSCRMGAAGRRPSGEHAGVKTEHVVQE